VNQIINGNVVATGLFVMMIIGLTIDLPQLQEFIDIFRVIVMVGLFGFANR
jgi:hypothetical protein